METTKLWGCSGRFGNGMNVDLAQLNNSLSVDRRLYAQDIEVSLAYAEVLADAGIIQSDELNAIRIAFKIVLREWESDEIQLRDDDEDVHSVNERRLIEIVGDVGRKLHTGRSRNDQVAVDMKLWMLDAIADVLSTMKFLLQTLIKCCEQKSSIIFPGYTHLQVSSPPSIMLSIMYAILLNIL